MSNPSISTEYDAAKLAQALLCFAGLLKDSTDPKAREAAHQLKQHVKQAKK